MICQDFHDAGEVPVTGNHDQPIELVAIISTVRDVIHTVCLPR